MSALGRAVALGLLTAALALVSPALAGAGTRRQSATATAAQPSQAAPAVGGFSVRPGEFDLSDPATRAYFKPVIAPGGRFAGTVIVTDPGAIGVRLSVYGVDGLTGTTSGAVYGDRSDRLHSAGRWLTTTAATVVVAPHSQRRVHFVVRVPSRARPGDHLAGVAFQDVRLSRTASRMSITEIFRVVIGVEIRVPGRAAPRLALTSLALRPLPGTRLASVVVGMSNRGGLLCKPSLAVSVRGAHAARIMKRQLDVILPGDAIAYPFPWPSVVARGTYTVSAQARGCGAAVSIRRTIDTDGRRTIDTGGPRSDRAGAVAPRAAQIRTILHWWELVMVAFAGILLGTAGLTVFRRVRR